MTLLTIKEVVVMEKIIIEGELPTLNEIIDLSKTHWAKYREVKRINTNLVAFIANRLPKFKAIKLDITYYRKDRRTDPDNIAASKKFILDGLVKSGVIKNDGWSEVKGFKESWEVDKNNPRIEVTIIPVKGG